MKRKTKIISIAVVVCLVVCAMTVSIFASLATSSQMSATITWQIYEVQVDVYGGVTGATGYNSSSNTSGNQYGATYYDNILAGAPSGTLLDNWVIGDLSHAKSITNDVITASDVVITLAIKNNGYRNVNVELSSLGRTFSDNQLVTTKWIGGVDIISSNPSANAYALANSSRLSNVTSLSSSQGTLAIAPGYAGIIQVKFNIVDPNVSLQERGTFSPILTLTSDNTSAGTGTEADPYIINSLGASSGTDAEIRQFNYYAGNNATDTNYFEVANNYFKLANDIVIPNESSILATDLLGHLDGNGYSITMNGKSALFDNVGSASNHTASISNLKVNNSSIAGKTINGNVYYAAIACISYGSITGCTSDGASVGTVISNSRRITPSNNGFILGAAGDSGSFMGGIVAYQGSGSTLSSSINKANLSLTKSTNQVVAKIGGLVGENAGTISDSYSTGAVSSNLTGSSSSSLIGGVVGNNTGIINKVYSTGAVNSVATGSSSTSYGAGISGLLSSGEISGSYATNQVVSNGNGASNSNVAAIANVLGGTIENCYSNSDNQTFTNNNERVTTTTDNSTITKANSSVISSYVTNNWGSAWRVLDDSDAVLAFVEGTGTFEDPFIISNIGPSNGALAAYGDYNYFAGNNSNGYDFFLNEGLSNYYFKLNKNLVIGASDSIIETTLMGTIDGDGYTIDGYKKVLTNTSDHAGLFNEVGGSIKNLGLTNVSITGTARTGSLFMGAFAGEGSGSFINCYSTGAINITSINGGGSFGGIAGTGSVFANCYSTININIIINADAECKVGGISGSAEYLSYCYYAGNINFKMEVISSAGIFSVVEIGGITNGPNSIYNCFVSGSIYAIGITRSQGDGGQLSSPSNSVFGDGSIGGYITGGCEFFEENQYSNCYYDSAFVSSSKFTSFSLQNDIGESKTKAQILSIISSNWDANTWNKNASSFPTLKKGETAIYIQDANDLKALQGKEIIGKDIIFRTNIDLQNYTWTPIKKLVNSTINGKNFTISNFKSYEYNSGCFLEIDQITRSASFIDKLTINSVIKNLTISNYTIEADCPSTIIGIFANNVNESDIINCKSNNCTIVAAGISDGNYDYNYFVGGIVGYIESGHINNCTASNIYIEAYLDLAVKFDELTNYFGGIAGYCNYGSYLNNNVAQGGKIKIGGNGENGFRAGGIAGMICDYENCQTSLKLDTTEYVAPDCEQAIVDADIYGLGQV